MYDLIQYFRCIRYDCEGRGWGFNSPIYKY